MGTSVDIEKLTKNKRLPWILAIIFGTIGVVLELKYVSLRLLDFPSDKFEAIPIAMALTVIGWILGIKFIFRFVRRYIAVGSFWLSGGIGFIVAFLLYRILLFVLLVISFIILSCIGYGVGELARKMNMKKRLFKLGIEPLIEAMQNENENFRCMAAECLGVMRAEGGVEPLIQILVKDKECLVRSAAIKALGKIGDIRAVDPIIEALKDEDYLVRSAAIKALGKIGDIRAVDSLNQALTDKDDTIRYIAKKALQNIKIRM